MKCKIVEVKDEISTKPLLVEFQNGSIKENALETMDCKVTFSKENKMLLVLHNQSDNYRFIGNKNMQESQMCQRFLTIRNRRTNKIRIVSLEEVVLTRYTGLEEDDKVDSPVRNKAVVDKSGNAKELKKIFGSKRAQKHTELTERLNISTKTIEAAIEKTTADIKVDDSNLNRSSANTQELLPPCNRDAVNVSDVYCVKTIIPEDVYESLLQSANEIMDVPPTSSDNDFSDFFIEVMKVLKGSLTKEKVICLIYMSAILKLLNIEAKKLNVKGILYQICPLSKQVRNSVVNSFTVSSKTGRARPIAYKDKGAAYILALLMIVFDFKIDTSVAIKALPSYGLKKLTHVAKALGFTILGDKWILRLPLPSLQPAAKGEKRKSIGRRK